MVNLTVDMPAIYEIKVHGNLGENGQLRFQGLAVSTGKSITSLSGRIADQAELLGILRQLVNLGHPLLEVRCREHQTDTEEALQ